MNLFEIHGLSNIKNKLGRIKLKNFNLIEESYEGVITDDIIEFPKEWKLFTRKGRPTKCLIIAAGKGSRLSKISESKPLTPILGLRLIERIILSVKEVGINDFYVVSGYKNKKVKEFLNQLSIKRKIKITHIENDEWRKGNGISVLKARDYIDDNFILLMCDHLFDNQILQSIKNEVIKDEVRLFVDYRINHNDYIDINDVTKVFVKNNKIYRIGKDIKNYNAFDTGIFLCSPIIFDALEESITNGNDTLSGGISILAKDGLAKAIDIGNKFWIDIDDEKSFKKAKKYLLSKLKKKSDGPVSKYINRPISITITKLLLKTNISPNIITIFVFLLGIAGASLFFYGGYQNLIIGVILAQLCSIIDGCDGEIARLKLQSSEFGGWLDAVLDRYVDAFILFGITFYVFSLTPNLFILFTGFLAIIGSFMNSYTAEKYDNLMKKVLIDRNSYFRIGRDVRMLILFICAIINQPILGLIILAVLMNIENIRRVLVFYKYKQM
ncbi:MAG: NTP transferase domain-containing protein [Candidatus Helarchaeota archaeon]